MHRRDYTSRRMGCLTDFTRRVSFLQGNAFAIPSQSHEVVTGCWLALARFAVIIMTRHHVRFSGTSAPVSLPEKGIVPGLGLSSAQKWGALLAGIDRRDCAVICQFSPWSHFVE